MRSKLTASRDQPQHLLCCPGKKGPGLLQLAPASFGVRAWCRWDRPQTTVGGGEKKFVRMFLFKSVVGGNGFLHLKVQNTQANKQTNKQKTLNSPSPMLNWSQLAQSCQRRWFFSQRLGSPPWQSSHRVPPTVKGERFLYVEIRMHCLCLTGLATLTWRGTDHFTSQWPPG